MFTPLGGVWLNMSVIFNSRWIYIFIHYTFTICYRSDIEGWCERLLNLSEPSKSTLIHEHCARALVIAGRAVIEEATRHPDMLQAVLRYILLHTNTFISLCILFIQFFKLFICHSYTGTSSVPEYCSPWSPWIHTSYIHLHKKETAWVLKTYKQA